MSDLISIGQGKEGFCKLEIAVCSGEEQLRLWSQHLDWVQHILDWLRGNIAIFDDWKIEVHKDYNFNSLIAKFPYQINPRLSHTVLVPHQRGPPCSRWSSPACPARLRIFLLSSSSSAQRSDLWLRGSLRRPCLCQHTSRRWPGSQLHHPWYLSWY